MNNTRLLATSLTLIAAVAIQMGGCLSSGNTDKPVTRQPDAKTGGPTNPKNPDTKRDTIPANTVTGTLRGGIAGIGGEHTGWQVERTSGMPPVEVDVSSVPNVAKQLDGKRVTITGKVVDKKYTERGVVKVFRAESMAENKSDRY